MAALAQSLNVFQDGQVADASRINENFAIVQQAIPTNLSDLNDDVGLSGCTILINESAQTANLTCSGVTVLVPILPDSDGDGYYDENASPVPIADCGPEGATIYPNAPELEDGIDNDCDGFIDEGFPGSDTDDDGVTVGDGDCNDFEANIFPGAVEICDNKDNDCNGIIDEGLEVTSCGGVGVCAGVSQSCSNGILPSCGSLFEQQPGFEATETSCDGLDNDCDGQVDEPCF